jgi:uncharacterized protein
MLRIPLLQPKTTAMHDYMGAAPPPPGEVQRPPLSLTNRLPSLDVLRGIAVLLALVVSVWAIGGFTDQQQKQLLVQSKGAGYRLYGAVELLFNGKMRALIALVFGASMILFLTRETVPGRQSTGEVFVKRQLWLIGFGLFNALALLWTEDILFHLGVMGILLFPFYRMRTKWLWVAVLFTTFAYCGKYYWNYADNQKTYRKYVAVTALEKKFEKDSVAKAKKGILAKKDTLTKIQTGDKKAWEGLLAGVKPDVKKDDGLKKALRHSSYAKVWEHRLPAVQGRQADWTYRMGIWDLASLMFLGMLLYRIGFFNGRLSIPRYVLIGLGSITIGLLLGWYRLHFQQISMQDYTKFIKGNIVPYNVFFPIEKGMMALGYASLVVAAVAFRPLGRITRGLAAVGQLALSNYFLQALICTLFFYGYGMGYFGRLTQVQLYFFAAEVMLVQVVGSVLWMRRYQYGPLEWLLRRLSGGKWLPRPFRKQPPSDTAIPVLS